jgi:hypothetical protein
MLIIFGTIVVLACLIAVIYYVGYRAGWEVGHDTAYRRMIGDLKQGKELFQSSGLRNWEIPKHWKKYQHNKLPEVEDPELVGKW